MESIRNAPGIYNLPRDTPDQRWYVVNPGGDCVATASTKDWAEVLCDGFILDADVLDNGYIVIDTEGL